MSNQPFVYYNPDNEYEDIEIWETEDDFDNNNLQALVGYLEQTYFFDNEAYFHTTKGFPLEKLKQSLEGIKYHIKLYDDRLDRYISPAGLFVDQNEPQFVPLISLSDLQTFAERFIEHGLYK